MGTHELDKEIRLTVYKQFIGYIH